MKGPVPAVPALRLSRSFIPDWHTIGRWAKPSRTNGAGEVSATVTVEPDAVARASAGT